MFNKKLMMLAIFFVLLLAVSAASASENITDEKIINQDIAEDVDETGEFNQNVFKLSENDTGRIEYGEDFEININNPNLTIGDPEGDYGELGSIYYPYGLYGNITVSIEDNIIHTYEIDGYGNYIYLDYFTLKLPFGQNTMKINYVNQTGTKQLYSGLINVDYYMKIGSGSDYYGEDSTDYPIYYEDSWIYHVQIPRDANGELYVSFDGNAYERVTYNRGSYVKRTSVKGLSIGAHKIAVKLLNDSFYPNKTAEYTFYVSPKITVPGSMSVGEKEFILIDFPDDYVGVVKIFNGTSYYDDVSGDECFLKDQIIVTANVGGNAKIEIPELKRGENLIFVNCSGSGDFEDYFYIDYYPNDPDFSSSINSNEVELGNDFILTINAPKSTRELNIYVDEQVYSSVSLDNGGITLPISKLSLGQHHIKLEFYSYSYDGNNQKIVDKFYSNSFYVTVKAKSAPKSNPSNQASKPAVKITMALKKVKVKKSAKKLVLQATLKQGKTPLKNKKITFKFNGKKYSAKTNKKGVAKVTIKKKVLKKLKVGKKVKYQASYGKVIVKKTVKVKK